MTEIQKTLEMDDAEKSFEDALFAGSSEEGKSKEAEGLADDSPLSEEEIEDEGGEIEKEDLIKESEKETTPKESTEKIILPKQVSKYPELKEGDYIKGEDGVYEIKAEHLAEDVSAILNQDAGIFLKIAKAKPDKAEAIANILGIKSDDTRNAVEVLSDVVKFLKTEKNEDKRTQTLQKYMPYIFDRNADVPFSFSEDLIPLGEDEKPGKVEVVDTAPSGSEIENAVYRVVAESKGTLDVDQLLDSNEMAVAVQKYRFDPSTGKPMSLYNQISMAAAEVFKGGTAEPKKEKEKIIPDPIGGVGAKTSKTKEAVPVGESDFEKALMGAL